MTQLRHKVKNALDEARTLILCAQVLLGFQFRAFFEQRFETLPLATRWVEMAGLGFLLVATVLLFMPAAFHRVVEVGENTERFHRFTGGMLVAAMVSLPLGIAADVFVVVRKFTESIEWSVISALLSLFMAWGLWFGVTLARKSKDARRQPHRISEARASV